MTAAALSPTASSTAASPPALEVRNLTTRFHSQEGVVNAVSGVSFSVMNGETVAIVGESGSGKSVTMLSIMGLLPPHSARVEAGEVLFEGQDLLKLDRARMRRVNGSRMAMIFQDPMSSLNPVLPVGFQIGEAIRHHFGVSAGEAMAKSIELAGLVGISAPEQRLKDYPHQFSGGMRQRVMIAMALACSPKLLIADEPTTALDVTIQAQILRLVKRLRATFGMSLIWITHDLGVVAKLADRVIVMYAGRVVEDAEVRAFYRAPQHPYSRGLLASLPQAGGSDRRKLAAIGGQPPNLAREPRGCSFAPRCPMAIDRCAIERPALTSSADDPRTRVACWRAGEAAEPTHAV